MSTDLAAGHRGASREREAVAVERGIRWLLRLTALWIPLSIFVSQLGVALAGVLWAVAALRGHGRPWPRLAITRPFVAFLAVCTVSAVVGLDPVSSLSAMHAYLWIGLLYLVVAHVREDRERTILVRCLVAGMSISAYHQLANHLYWTPDPADPARHVGMFAPSWFPGKMTRAHQLVIGLSVITAFLLAARGTARRIGWAVLFVNGGAGLVATLKRGAAVAVVASISVQLWARARRLLPVFLLVTFVVVRFYPPLWERVLLSLRDFVHADNRLRMWTIGWDLFRHNPWLGIGTENGTIMQNALLWGPEPPHHRHFHNDAITIAVENGAVGLVAFLAFLWTLGRSLFERLRASDDEDRFRGALAMGAFAAFLGWNVGGLTEFNFGDSEVMLALHLVTGLALSLPVASAAAGTVTVAAGATPASRVGGGSAPTASRDA